MSSVTERWRVDRVMSALYNAAAMHHGAARVGAKVLWGASLDELLDEVRRVEHSPAGARILDVPCGGGFAFRGVRPGQDCRYVAADISPDMLDRASGRADRFGLSGLMEFTQADVTDLPFPDNTFDLVLTFNGLHCLPDPRAALVELARVTTPGGILRGTTCVRGRGRRQDRFATALQMAGIFGNPPQAGDVRRWVQQIGFEDVVTRSTGAVEIFEARKQANCD